jgi:hypothetical protein
MMIELEHQDTYGKTFVYVFCIFLRIAITQKNMLFKCIFRHLYLFL